MYVTFLGTAGAEGYPNPFCRCANCERARAYGGPSLRKRSSALINDDLLIDLGPDLTAASLAHRCSLTAVRYCLQTHAHADHLNPSHLLTRSPAYGVAGAPRLHFYASAATLSHLTSALMAETDPLTFLDREVGERLNVTIHQVEPLQSFSAGPYQVMALPATHDPTVEPLLYVIETGGRHIFYGIDTGPLCEDIWRAFHRQALRFDVVILDHTLGSGALGREHLNAAQFVEHLARLREEGLLADDARVFAHHLAHTGNDVHPEAVSKAARHGYEVAHDGLIV